MSNALHFDRFKVLGQKLYNKRFYERAAILGVGVVVGLTHVRQYISRDKVGLHFLILVCLNQIL